MNSLGKVRILIADDEPLACKRLRSLLPQDASVEIIGEYGNGPEASEAIRRDRPDIAFLDMQMPGCDGLKLVDELRPEERPAIVFVTAHDKYAVKAFDARAVDYVLKPYDRERIETALRRAVEQVNARRSGDLGAKLESLLADAGAAAKPERLTVKTGTGFVFLKLDEIVWVEAADNYITLHLTDRTLTVRETLSSLEARLGTAHFARVNRSALVHLDQVKELQPTFHGDYVVVLRNGARLPLSRALRGDFGRFASGAL